MDKEPKYIKSINDIGDLKGMILKILYFVLIEVMEVVQNVVQ